MELETRGGWRAAIDPGLAARLLRPAVRPGVTDPAHGPALAARLQRMAAPTLAGDVARRYGTTVLDAGRSPVVYATPPIQQASMASRRGDAGSSGTLRKDLDARRPMVQGTVRAAGPVFPPLRPLGTGPVVQRMADATPEVAVARRIGMEASVGAPTEPRGGDTSVPARLVVAPAPTRLQRQVAAEHAEAVPITASVLPRVHARQTAGGGGEALPAAGGAGGRGAGPGYPGPARAAATADVVQRRIDPAAAHLPHAVPHPAEAQGTPFAKPPVVLAALGGGGGAGAAVSKSAALPVAVSTGTAGGGGTVGGVVQAIRAHPGVAVQRMDATANPPAGGPGAELPTMTAGDAPGTHGARGSDAAELAEQVYGLLVRRLENERKQRGW